MARGGTINKPQLPAIHTADDLYSFLKWKNIYSFRSADRIVMPSLVKYQPWELSVGIQFPLMDFIVPMQRLHPMLDPHDIAVLILNINARLELPGFALNGSRRQVYLRLPVLLGCRGIAPSDVIRLIATASDTVGMYGRHFDYVGGDECVLGQVPIEIAAACDDAQLRAEKWMRLRDLVSNSPMLQEQRSKQLRWIGDANLMERDYQHE
jgi:hypothetical protein